ncbi:hypothetical protein OEZ85_001910 [Tetradesmus obliquus]|uniref:Poly(A) RNA polymerase mitochondrial-like central palm domain-containing protein n=1 Tax=Tetradesmus obliquus TaxID=3088 RepID=A0ABY8U1K5_TETOB|nr:hypothetical protein OEZ85_001910 [Tetradesmus obliquus]
MELECEAAWAEFKRQRSWQEPAVQQTDHVLSRIVQALRPSAVQWRERQAVIERVRSVLAGMPDFQPRYGDQAPPGQCLAQLHVFGSFCSGLYHKASDLDLTIIGRWRNRHGTLLDMHAMSSADLADMLHRIRRALIARGVAGTADPSNQPMVINARVPLVMFADAASGVAVDISVCNHAGAFKSRFTEQLVAFDERFEALYRLVKLWAEVHRLNEPKMGTLNSWSLTQMVIFHLQSCRPAILPPLWLLFHNEPPQGPRPLEQQQQQGVSQSPGNSRSRRQAQQSLMRSGAPYPLLHLCQQQRARYQPIYNAASGSSSSSSSSSSGGCWQQGLAELLAGFFVRFGAVLELWLEQGRHRELRMSTWLGKWHDGGPQWQHEYLAAFEDPFDAADNAARTLGTAERHDGGCWKLQQQLASARSTCAHLSSSTDVDSLLLALFDSTAGEVLQQSFDPISKLMLQQQQQQRQPQQQRVNGQRQQRQAVQPQQQQQSGTVQPPRPQQTTDVQCVLHPAAVVV